MQINNLDGWWIADKPLGITSATMVAQIKKQLLTEYNVKFKIGHMGALDPFATGILPIGIGKNTKYMDWMLLQPKTYVASARFGWETDTEDFDGIISNTSNNRSDYSSIQNAVNTFKGEIFQRPSSHSALKINGVRSYKLARQAETILQPRKVTIHAINIDFYSYPELSITVTCSRGTYIRALIRDIGQACGSRCVMSSLKRIKYGPFNLGWCKSGFIQAN